MIKSLQVTLAAVSCAALLFSACRHAPTKATAAGSAGSRPEDPNMPVAKYNDVTVTLKDLDATLAPQLKQLEKQKWELRQQGLEQMVVEALVKVEAAKVGQTDEQWVQAQLDARLPPPSDAEIQNLWDESKDKVPPGATLDAMRPQIIGFLRKEKSREVSRALFGELKEKAHYQPLLKAPRAQVAAVGPSRGPEDAEVTIVEFADFECPFCGKAEASVSQVMEKYAGRVRLVFRHFPLSFHANAAKAAEASMCANEQGKFWEMHKVLFANRTELTVDHLKKYAATVGLDVPRFSKCLDGNKMEEIVEKDIREGGEAGVLGTPVFFINDKVLQGAQPAGEFEKIIDAELKKAE